MYHSKRPPIPSPCYKCKDRAILCHSECLKYKKYTEELEAIKAENTKDREALEFEAEAKTRPFRRGILRK